MPPSANTTESGQSETSGSTSGRRSLGQHSRCGERKLKVKRILDLFLMVGKSAWSPNGRVYFVNHKNRTTQWEDPRTQGQFKEEPLPPGWECRVTGKFFYQGLFFLSSLATDPFSSTYFRAREVTTLSIITLERQRFKIRDRVLKLSGEKEQKEPTGFRCNTKGALGGNCLSSATCGHSNALPSHIKLSVSRTTLFEDSFHQLMRLPAFELRRTAIHHILEGREGLDYGGVSR